MICANFSHTSGLHLTTILLLSSSSSSSSSPPFLPSPSPGVTPNSSSASFNFTSSLPKNSSEYVLAKNANALNECKYASGATSYSISVCFLTTSYTHFGESMIDIRYSSASKHNFALLNNGVGGLFSSSSSSLSPSPCPPPPSPPNAALPTGVFVLLLFSRASAICAASALLIGVAIVKISFFNISFISFL